MCIRDRLVPIKDFVKLRVFSDLKPAAPIIASVAGLILPPIVYVVSPFLIRFFAWVIPFVLICAPIHIISAVPAVKTRIITIAENQSEKPVSYTHLAVVF